MLSRIAIKNRRRQSMPLQPVEGKVPVETGTRTPREGGDVKLTVLVSFLILTVIPAMAQSHFSDDPTRTSEFIPSPPHADLIIGAGVIDSVDSAYVGSAQWVKQLLEERNRADNNLWTDEIGKGRVNLRVFKTILENIADEILLVDVRTEQEYIAGHVPTAINIPVKDLKKIELYDIMFQKISLVTPVIFICATGKRAALAYQLFSNQPNFYYVGDSVRYQKKGGFVFSK